MFVFSAYYVLLTILQLADRKVPMKGGLPAKEKAPELSVAQLLAGKHEDFMFFQVRPISNSPSFSILHFTSNDFWELLLM